MQISHLEYYVETIKCRSINKAALSLRVDPSTLSAALKSLENEIGHELLIRSRNGTIPTERGLMIYEDAQMILQIYHKWLSPNKELTDSVETVQVSISHLAYNTLCPELSLEFSSFKQKAIPVFNVSFYNSIFSTNCDFIISNYSSEIDYVALNSYILQKSLQLDILIPNDPFMVFLNRQHPLASHNKIYLDELANEPFIYFSEKFPFEADDPRNKIVSYRGNDHSHILRLIANGKGYSLLPSMCKLLCNSLMLTSVVAIPLADYTNSTTYYFIHPPYSSLSSGERSVVKHIKEYCKNIEILPGK